MAVIVYAETWEGKFKKATFEAVSYGAKVAEMMGTEAIAVILGNMADDGAILAKYGAAKIVNVSGDALSSFNNAHYAKALCQIAKANSAHTLIISGTNNGKMVAPFASVGIDAALITNVLALPESTEPMRVMRGAFSSKGLANYESTATNTVLVITPNAVGVAEIAASGAMSSEIYQPDTTTRVAKVENVDRATGKIALPEAELVVSAGRGMKAPENWGMIEELANTLGAATACSKPVSDIGWRPHSEHVGQTGIQINPNLYIAIGISGAIQHLAGVSASKTIVVINSDPEAPFFKAADYGIVGDAFEVVPKLTEAIKAYKAAN